MLLFPHLTILFAVQVLGGITLAIRKSIWYSGERRVILYMIDWMLATEPERRGHPESVLISGE